jgi:CheY-like chemotaxis protein
MEPEVAARAFEPFFTTKALGAGTGLGLATVHGLVAQGGGRVAIESTPGHGTSIEILLPLHAAADVAAVRSVDSIPSGTERILVVDDEPALRQATARILRLHEYDVLEAADGAAALAILDAPESAIDLVLTDISMKHMSGRELGAEIARRNTATPVIYITGYNSPESGTTPGRVLHKPVAEAALLGAIRDELDRIHT